MAVDAKGRPKKLVKKTGARKAKGPFKDTVKDAVAPASLRAARSKSKAVLAASLAEPPYLHENQDTSSEGVAPESLVERVSRSIERELTRIDVILEGVTTDQGQHAEAERRARTLASLARTLREVTSLRNEQGKQKPADDDDIPRDIEQLRRELARRLEGLVAEAKIVCPDEAEGH